MRLVVVDDEGHAVTSIERVDDYNFYDPVSREALIDMVQEAVESVDQN